MSEVATGSDPIDRASKIAMFVKELGVPVAMLLILSFGGYQALSWVGENLLGPMVKDQRENNKELTSSLKSLTTSMEKLADESIKHSARLDTITNDIKEIRINQSK
jgi:hypothetical protein